MGHVCEIPGCVEHIKYTGSITGGDGCISLWKSQRKGEACRKRQWWLIGVVELAAYDRKVEVWISSEHNIPKCLLDDLESLIGSTHWSRGGRGYILGRHGGGPHGHSLISGPDICYRRLAKRFHLEQLREGDLVPNLGAAASLQNPKPLQVSCSTRGVMWRVSLMGPNGISRACGLVNCLLTVFLYIYSPSRLNWRWT